MPRNKINQLNRKGVSVGTATKNIQKFYFDRTSAFYLSFGRFGFVDFNRNTQIRLGRTPNVDKDVMLEIVKNKPGITAEEVANSWKLIAYQLFSI